MSITVTYYRLPGKERESVTRDQSSWQPFRQRIDNAHYKSFQSAIDALEGFSGSPEEKFAKLNSLIQETRDPRRFNLEKDWHAVVYLLTGKSELVEEHREDDLLHSVIFGGHPASATTGYGAVRYYDEGLVARTAAALRGADRALLAQRCDPARMAESGIYAPPEDETERAGVLDVIEDLTAFFGAAADAREDVIKFVT